MADFDPLDRRIRESFSRMTEGADPGRVTAAVREKIGFEKERKKGNTMKHPKKLTVILAAAAAVILLTTAAAAAVMAVQAVQAKMRADIPPAEKTEEGFIQSYSMEIEEHTGSLLLSDDVMAALNELSPRGENTEMNTDANAEAVIVPFECWQDAADWLDCGLLVDPQLGPAPYEAGQLRLFYYDGIRFEDHSVSLLGVHTYPDTRERVIVSAFIPLNDAAWETYSGGLYSPTHDEPQEAETDSMITPSGEEVTLIFTPVNPVPGGMQYELSAHFIHEGIIYKISVWTTDREGGESVVRRVVEGMRIG